MKKLVFFVLIYGLINGGLWLYWSNAHSEENKVYAEVKPWLKENQETLQDLESQADNATSQEEFDEIKSEYDDLLDEYNANVDEYNNAVDVLNDEFYLIPLPGKHHE